MVTAILAFAFLIEACFGFGGGLMAIPLLSLFMLPKDAVFLMLVFQCLKIFLLIPCWRHISWRSMKLLPVGMVFGIILGTFILDVVSPHYFKFGLALYLMVFVALDWMSFETIRQKVYGRHEISSKNPFWKRGVFQKGTGSFVAGLAGGTISGITGMGGPPYVTYLRKIGLDKQSFRASIIFIVCVGNFLRISIDAQEVIHNQIVRENFLTCFVAFVLVSIVGSHLPKFLSEKTFKHLINSLLMAASLLLFYKGFGG